MPLRCVDTNNKQTSIQAFDLSHDEWDALRIANRANHHLVMPCCPSQAVLKRSPLGKQFFAHKSKVDCVTAPESEDHLHLKEMAVKTARAHGWTANTEMTGTTPSGETWRADVFAQKGKHKVAVEIQLSSQTYEEILRRQARYEQSGIRCFWLLRKPLKRAPTYELPAAQVIGTPGSFLAIGVPMQEFFDALFSGRLRFGVPVNFAATVRVYTRPMECWRCKAETRIIGAFEVAFGPNECRLSVLDLDKFPDIFEEIRGRLPNNLGTGIIKPRFSNIMGHPYLSNGCAHCDALIGAHFEFYAMHEEEEKSCSFPIRISTRWRDAIERSGKYDKGWAIYSLLDKGLAIRHNSANDRAVSASAKHH